MRKVAAIIGTGAIALATVFGGFTPAQAASEPAAGSITVTGTLTAISGTALPSTLSLLVGATTYTVEVPTTAKILRRYNGTSDLGEFLIGDRVEVRGTALNDAANSINATRVKNWTMQRVGGTFKGTIVTTDCVNNTFTFLPDKRVQQTVYLSSTTKITRGGEVGTCAGLKNGERAKVIGLWRQSSNRIDADRVVVDMKTISGTIASITLTNGGLQATLTLERKVKVHSSSVRASTSDSTETTTETWTVNVTSATKLFRRYMGKATIEEFLVGDKLEVRGTRTATANTLNANVIRNNTLTIKFGDFTGTVKSVDATAQTFVLRVSSKKFGDVTVTTTASTKYVDENGLRTFADVSVGDKVKVLGTYTSNTKKLAATRIFFKEAQSEVTE
ncbi:MAG: DUF5666 domain-containing protein [Patescibacteria group bacterium]|jgi:hypothetical protein